MGAIPPSPAASKHAPEGWSWPASEQPSPLPGRRRRAAVVVVIAALVLPATWWAWARLGGPADGAVTYPASGWRGDGVPVAWVIGPPTGLRPGDLVVAVDGRSLESGWVATLRR
jgi:hypothetical protein